MSIKSSDFLSESESIDTWLNTCLHVAHSSKIVDLRRFHFGDDFHEACRVGEVAVVQRDASYVRRLVPVQVFDAAGVEGARATNDSVNLKHSRAENSPHHATASQMDHSHANHVAQYNQRKIDRSIFRRQ